MNADTTVTLGGTSMQRLSETGTQVPVCIRGQCPFLLLQLPRLISRLRPLLFLSVYAAAVYSFTFSEGKMSRSLGESLTFCS